MALLRKDRGLPPCRADGRGDLRRTPSTPFAELQPPHKCERMDGFGGVAIYCQEMPASGCLVARPDPELRAGAVGFIQIFVPLCLCAPKLSRTTAQRHKAKKEIKH